jgi:glycosyltransferase involved in cell wall biosynthesis
MLEQRKISIAIPTWNRSEMTVQSFYEVYDDDRVSEIVIVDDASDMKIYEELKAMTDSLSKVTLYRNLQNRDCYENKYTAVSYATNDWVILLDSDNKIDKSYLDIIFGLEWDKNTSYMPSFAAPTFNYQEFAGTIVSKENVAQLMGRPLFDTMLNCMNFFVNVSEYLRVWQPVQNPKTADSIFFNYCWFKEGNEMYVVPNLTYQHLIHSGSHYVNNNHLTPTGLYESIVEKLKELK